MLILSLEIDAPASLVRVKFASGAVKSIWTVGRELPDSSIIRLIITLRSITFSVPGIFSDDPEYLKSTVGRSANRKKRAAIFVEIYTPTAEGICGVGGEPTSSWVTASDIFWACLMARVNSLTDRFKAAPSFRPVKLKSTTELMAVR